MFAKSIKFDAVNGMLSKNSSALKDPSVVSKVAIGFDDAIACIRLLNKLLLLTTGASACSERRRRDDVFDHAQE